MCTCQYTCVPAMHTYMILSGMGCTCTGVHEITFCGGILPHTLMVLLLEQAHVHAHTRCTYMCLLKSIRGVWCVAISQHRKKLILYSEVDSIAVVNWKPSKLMHNFERYWLFIKETYIHTHNLVHVHVQFYIWSEVLGGGGGILRLACVVLPSSILWRMQEFGDVLPSSLICQYNFGTSLYSRGDISILVSRASYTGRYSILPQPVHLSCLSLPITNVYMYMYCIL